MPGVSDAGRALKGPRPACFGRGGDLVDTSVYDRYALRPGMQLAGPAIIEVRESTIVVGPRMSAEVDPYFNVVVHL